MHVAATMAISDFELAPVMVKNLSERVDTLVLRFDANNGNPELFDECREIAVALVDNLILISSNLKWNRWNWREEMLRELDNIQPDIVLTPDSDEMYDDTLEEELVKFYASGRHLMMFPYKMITNDKRPVKKYPGAPHCKALRWVPGISYKKYRGHARPSWTEIHVGTEYMTSCRVLHYCFYTPEMETQKLNNLHK